MSFTGSEVEVKKIAMLLFGTGLVIFPTSFREYKMWELFGNRRSVSRVEKVCSRGIGLIMIAAALLSW
ncbi:hypothetical protein [Azotosporobacter soli]|uniref:hypothetical protein n=1 Tax=Azotosporobacter soli TaxID=3055040 RepID=UPI0031FEFDA1